MAEGDDVGQLQHAAKERVGPEVMYAVRRTDGEDIGDYSFMVASGPDDWSYVEDDNDDATEYEMVKLTLERVAVKTFGAPACDNWQGSYSPQREWFDVVIESESEDTWPARDHKLATNESEADAEIRVAMLPEVFIVADGYGAYEVRREQLRIERHELAPYPLDCDNCGQSFYAHDNKAAG